MRAPLWPTELPRPGTPPGIRTRSRSLRRRMRYPLCASGVCFGLATSESNRALPPHQGGPFDRLGRGQRKRGESNAQGRSSSGFKPAAVANLLALPKRGERRTRTATLVTPIRFRGGARNPGGFTLHKGSPARCEQAGDSRGRRSRIPRHSCRRPVSGRGQPPGWFILHGRRRPTRTARSHPRIR